MVTELARMLAVSLPVAEKADVERIRRRVLTVNGSNPDAGSEFTYKVEGTAIMWPLSVMATLSAAAGGSDRGVWLEYRDPTGVRYCVAGAPVTVSPDTSQTFCWQPSAGTPSWPIDDVAVAPLPVQPLDGYSILAVVIGNAGASDQLSEIRLRAEFEWSNPDDFPPT